MHRKVSGEAHSFVTEILEPKDKVDGWIWSIKRVRSTISYTCLDSIHSLILMYQPTTSKVTQIQHRIPSVKHLHQVLIGVKFHISVGI